MNDNDTAAGTEYLKYTQAAVLLNVKVNTLYCWVSRGVIPHVRLSPRVVRFRRKDLDAWLAERSVLPAGAAPRS